MNPIKIFVADDHPVVRGGLIAVLSTQDDFEIIGEAENGKVLLKEIDLDNTDILFLDLEMPEMDGLEVIQALKTKTTSVKIIVFTVFDTDERIVSAIKAGAKGYLLKGANKEEIFNAVRIVHSGGSLLQPAVANKLFQHISNDTEALSHREMEVLKLISKGKKNSDIAQQLFISERTVKFHVSAILSKLNVKNRTEAVRLALKKGIINL